MSEVSSNNRRLVKNTLYLYFRMAIIMVVKLYTSRVLLESLGIDDFGIWNVVAAFVVSFSFISGPLVTAIQRFLNFDIGKGGNQVNKIFNIGFFLFFIIAIFIVILLETGGIWFINHQMNFPPGKFATIHWIYQLSIITFFVNLIRMSYEAALVATERFTFYALCSIVEASLLLFTAILIQFSFWGDKLIAYCALTTLVTIIIYTCFSLYCKKNIAFTKFNFCWDKKIVKEIGAFSGWNFLGGMSSMTANQGVNILMNMFFGVALNAAYGISMQIRGAVSVVLDNILKAANPQITQSYASSEYTRLNQLLSNVLKISYSLCLAFIIPLIINIDFILEIWLGANIPPYTRIFAILTLVQLLIVSLGNPIDVAIFATGKIRGYQICLSALIFLNIIICYILFKLGQDATSAFVVKCLVELLIIIARFIFLKIRLNISLKAYFKDTMLPIICLTASIVCLMLLAGYFIPFGEKWHRILISNLIYFPLFAISFWIIVLKRSQRSLILNFLKTKI